MVVVVCNDNEQTNYANEATTDKPKSIFLCVGTRSLWNFKMCALSTLLGSSDFLMMDLNWPAKPNSLNYEESSVIVVVLQCYSHCDLSTHSASLRTHSEMIDVLTLQISKFIHTPIFL